MNVAFLNENTLGHTSYLPRFAQALSEHPEWGITPHLIDVVPMPPQVQQRADFTVRGLRKVGLDFHLARWRRVASRHARNLLESLDRRERIEAVVVNTQSVGLCLADPPLGVPLFVCLDATFRQLAASRWFAMNRMAGWLLPLTLAPLRRAERRLFARTNRFLPWSGPVRDSLVQEYGVPPDRVSVLPPSLDLERLRARRRNRPSGARPQILFLGGEFRRKGGPLLLEAFRGELARRADLHVITQSQVDPEPGVTVHHGVTALSEAWFERWNEADVFVFPSALETFGIVLLEALAFEVPAVASQAGAAVEILDRGQAGWLLEEVCPKAVGSAIREVLDDPQSARARAVRGRERVMQAYDLQRNTERLAGWLRAETATARWTAEDRRQKTAGGG